MSEIFNKYGNPSMDGPLAELEKTICDTAVDYFEKAQEMGASIVEIRALAGRLMSLISSDASFVVLRTQAEMKKKDREEIKEHLFKKRKFVGICPHCGQRYSNTRMVGEEITSLRTSCHGCGDFITVFFEENSDGPDPDWYRH